MGENAQVNKHDEGYFGYYIFVVISAVIGFITLYAFTKITSRILVEKDIISINMNNNLIAVIVASVGVVIFVLLALLLKKFLKGVFLSEIFLYLYMGVLTTAINVIVFDKLLTVFAKDGTSTSVGWKIAEAFAFIIAVIFAFVTNKIFVFKNMSLNGVFKEFGGFIIARLGTELINFIIMWIFIDKMGYNSMIIKVTASVIVIILNYIFSKFLIFKKK